MNWKTLLAYAPNNKEYNAGAGGILACIVIGVFAYFGHDLGPTVDSALIVIFPTIIAKITPASDQAILLGVNDDIAQAGTLLGKLTPASDSSAPVTLAAVALKNKVS